MSPRFHSAVVLAVFLAGCSWSTTPPASPPLLGVPARAGVVLQIPVAGVAADQLRDSYDHPRSGGRTHHAIDIMAPHRTPVVAAADGSILKLHRSGAGGTTLYQLAADRYTVFYYAHLDGYAAGLSEGDPVIAGQVIAYVGDTGNAGRGNYHLHFSVAHLADPRRWWEGRNVNPYPLLTGSGLHAAR